MHLHKSQTTALIALSIFPMHPYCIRPWPLRDDFQFHMKPVYLVDVARPIDLSLKIHFP